MANRPGDLELYLGAAISGFSLVFGAAFLGRFAIFSGTDVALVCAASLRMPRADWLWDDSSLVMTQMSQNFLLWKAILSEDFMNHYIESPLLWT